MRTFAFSIPPSDAIRSGQGILPGGALGLLPRGPPVGRPVGLEVAHVTLDLRFA